MLPLAMQVLPLRLLPPPLPTHACSRPITWPSSSHARSSSITIRKTTRVAVPIEADISRIRVDVPSRILRYVGETTALRTGSVRIVSAWDDVDPDAVARAA